MYAPGPGDCDRAPRSSRPALAMVPPAFDRPISGRYAAGPGLKGRGGAPPWSREEVENGPAILPAGGYFGVYAPGPGLIRSQELPSAPIFPVVNENLEEEPNFPNLSGLGTE